jgi:hypothetical protein
VAAGSSVADEYLKLVWRPIDGPWTRIRTLERDCAQRFEYSVVAGLVSE